MRKNRELKIESRRKEICRLIEELGAKGGDQGEASRVTSDE